MDASVMIVEDNESVREPLAALLRLKGYVVVETDNGQDALKKLKGLPMPNLVVLDLMMPQMDGESFLEAKDADPELAPIPVVIVSAVANGQGPARSDTVVDVLQKPGDMSRLLSLVDKYCGTDQTKGSYL